LALKRFSNFACRKPLRELTVKALKPELVGDHVREVSAVGKGASRRRPRGGKLRSHIPSVYREVKKSARFSDLDNPTTTSDANQSIKMKTPKFFELIGSSKGGKTDPRFRLYVELTDKDQDFWESQALGTPEGRAQLNALRAGLLEMLPKDTELSEAPVATFFGPSLSGVANRLEALEEFCTCRAGRLNLEQRSRSNPA
jgi:hypothetical protein